METRQRTQQRREEQEIEKEEGGRSRVSAELEERRREARGCLQILSHHSYWFDVWIFLLFDLVLLIFIYLLP